MKHNCFCGSTSVGYSTNFIQWKWYCNKHFWSHKSQVDKWLESQEQKQWGDQEWYQEQSGDTKPLQLELK